MASPGRRVTPGEVIYSNATDFLRGHGTFVRDSQLVAGVAGVVEQVDRLVSVRPFKQRWYAVEVGDVCVGQVEQIERSRWLVDINGRQTGVLQLSGINLPGGEQRRRTAQDQLASFYVERDLLSCEVQALGREGGAVIHTRNAMYGKLEGGMVVRVPASLVKRQVRQFHTFSVDAGADVHVIHGLNGCIWVAPGSDAPEALLAASRVRNAVLCLAGSFMSISIAAVDAVVRQALALDMSAAEMATPTRWPELTAPLRLRRPERGADSDVDEAE